MKISIIVVTAILILSLGSNFNAQSDQSEDEMLRNMISEDVNIASKEANIEANESLLKAFVDIGFSQKSSAKQVYASVPKNVRIARLAYYMLTKAQVGGMPSNVTSDGLGDFHWGYIAKNTKYLPFRLDSPGTAKLVRIEYVNGLFDFYTKGIGIQPGTALLVPTFSDQVNANVSATFELGDHKALWTGNPHRSSTFEMDEYKPLGSADSIGNVLKVGYSETRKGCEIYIYSQPPQATIYFNDKKYHEPTNTSSVRVPGIWEVVVHRKGFKEWRDKRELGAGDSWTIKALLIKQ